MCCCHCCCFTMTVDFVGESQITSIIANVFAYIFTNHIRFHAQRNIWLRFEWRKSYLQNIFVKIIESVSPYTYLYICMSLTCFGALHVCPSMSAFIMIDWRNMHITPNVNCTPHIGCIELTKIVLEREWLRLISK